MSIPFIHEFEFEYAKAEQISPLIRRVVAPNSGPFTFHGTGTYIVGHGQVAVIDPGPDLRDHIEALLAAVAGETVTHIVITHTHRDHSPAAAALQRATGAKTYGYGRHGGGRQPDGEEVEAGADWDFVPDVMLSDGDVLESTDWLLEAIFTPGHTANHLCFALPQEQLIFTGDHVMGWSTTVVSPPDGNMGDYFASLEKLQRRPETLFWPTHGPAIDNPQVFVAALIAHRRKREQQILHCVAAGADQVPQMVAEMYRDVPSHLHGAAARSVLAHLIHLVETARLDCDTRPSLTARYRQR